MDKLLDSDNIANENISEENKTAHLAVETDDVRNEENAVSEAVANEMAPAAESAVEEPVEEPATAGDDFAELLVESVDSDETDQQDEKVSSTDQAEKIKETNLAAKKQIIEKLKELIESKDDFYKIYNEFRKLQQQWKIIKQIPQSAVNDLWKEYQYYSEKFYDLLKINNEMRDYDFRKNLELDRKSVV
jgi:hypothetical protein